MVYYLIVCRSLTRAQKVASVLKRGGIAPTISRPPRNLSEEGCGYCVKIAEKHLHDALLVLNKAGLNREKIHVLYSDGTNSEVGA